MGMGAFIIRRLLMVIPTLVGCSILIFAVTQLINPYLRATLYITNEKQLARIDDIVKKFGLNDPVYVQYSRWMSQVLRGNLGWSYTANMPVATAMIRKFPATFEVVLFSAPIIVILGIFLGVQSAVRRDKWFDHITRSVAIVGWSLPSFWLAMILIAVFYVGLGWFGPHRLGNSASMFVTSRNFTQYTGLNTIDGLLNGQPWITVDALTHLVLPVTVLTVIQIALIIRVMRSSMLEALNKNYVVMARAKGLKNSEVINRHARRNALIPTVTLSGLLVAGMMTGVVITETVFGINGIGRFAADAAIARGGGVDMAAILGFTLFTALVFIFANLIVDIAYAYLDPRIRLD
jgi:peptide/nickel transport system permease protein